MKITKKTKSLLGIFIILAIAVTLDLTYDTIVKQTAVGINFRLWGRMINLRPLLLVIVYTVFFGIGSLLLSRDDSDHFLSWLLILGGLAVMYLITFTPGRQLSPAIRDFYSRLKVIILASPLGLTMHSIAFLTGLGFFRVIRYRFHKR